MSSTNICDWSKHFSKSKNLYYWFNCKTNESFWDIEDKNDSRFWIKLESKKSKKKLLV